MVEILAPVKFVCEKFIYEKSLIIIGTIYCKVAGLTIKQEIL